MDYLTIEVNYLLTDENDRLYTLRKTYKGKSYNLDLTKDEFTIDHALISKANHIGLIVIENEHGTSTIKLKTFPETGAVIEK